MKNKKKTMSNITHPLEWLKAELKYKVLIKMKCEKNFVDETINCHKHFGGKS